MAKSFNPPWYSQGWAKFKQFPQVISRGNNHPPPYSGEAAAAFLSMAIGCVTMAIGHHLSETDRSKTIENALKVLGNWIPGTNNPDKVWGNIGSYAGQETLLLVGWWMSWAILYFLWRDRSVKPRTLFVGLMALMTLATAMAWHPLFPYLPLA